MLRQCRTSLSDMADDLPAALVLVEHALTLTGCPAAPNTQAPPPFSAREKEEEVKGDGVKGVAVKEVSRVPGEWSAEDAHLLLHRVLFLR